MKILFERNINSVVKQVDKDHILTEASLLDLNHSMRVTLKIHLKTREIVQANADISKAPLKFCDQTLQLVKKLEGHKIERGINQKLLSFLGKSDGCTHLYELALNAVRLSFNIFIGLGYDWNEWINRKLPDAEFTAKAMPHLQNTCLPFKVDNKK